MKGEVHQRQSELAGAVTVMGHGCSAFLLFTVTGCPLNGSIDASGSRFLSIPHRNAGAVIRGTAGARKLRVALRGGGKSGGARVIYVHVAERAKVYLLLAYGKGVTDSISDVGRKVLAHEVRRIQAEV